jgi:type I restriction enzyme S subunit
MNETMTSHTIPDGYKQSEVGVIPKDWDIAPLNEVCNFGGGTTPPRAQHERYFVNGSNNWVKTTDLNNSLVDFSEEQITDLAISETGLKKHPVGTVLVAMYGGFNQIGRTGYITRPSAINQALVAVKPKAKKLDSYYLLSELNYNVDYWKGVASSSRKDPNITSNDVKNYTIALPALKEQAVIANTLSDIDSLLSELEKLIVKKQAIKTATMQQLLTGKTRLPQFNTYTEGAPEGKRKGQLKSTKPSELGEIPEDWEVFRIGDLAFIDPDNLDASTLPGYEFEYISLEQVHYGVLKDTTTYTYQTAPSRARRILKKDDVLVSTVRPNLKSHYHIKTNVTDLICSTGFSVIRSKRSKLVAEIIFQHLFCYVINNQIEMIISGSNYPAINSGEVKNLKIQIGSIEEQTAIANILSDMDEEIQALEKRLSKTRQIKQGMMQELLTGKTRLPFNKN